MQFLQKHWWKILLLVIAVIGVKIIIAQDQSSNSLPPNVSKPPAATTEQRGQAEDAEIRHNWQLKNGWYAKKTPPACPEPLQFATPVDLTNVNAILYPGQVRGGAYKPHGGLRFNQDSNNVTVTIPLDAEIIRGSRAFRNGENQYSFEFIAPCGIWYSFGHFLELTPKFKALADELPLIEDANGVPPLKQIFPLSVGASVKTGEVIATAVGYAKTNNVFFDWGVLDLRHKNGFTIRPEWKDRYADEFDEYGVCWLDMLPPTDSDRIKALPGGDHETGKMSDYCK